ncbi:MAG: tRNA (adenosine(37)-N6)-threonylcarbamoyltransferase complex dimerization subunit type 1 TsaB [Chloroflexaceae bacterium]|nr:tRNA (adenosine(37)-N6)-threonylcarbamoyltransferase complex dimerization subunit type 1 TsaB [Chloroflexaceae bacterium]
MLLAIDTSTDLSGVAFYAKDAVLGECTWHSGRHHTSQVLAQVDLLLKHTGYHKHELTAVAVALGPGSWSGLRVGMSIAKGMVLAQSLKLIGVSTLDALAYQYQSSGLPTYPIIRLGRDRFACALFLPNEGQQRRLSEYRNISLAEIGKNVPDETLFCGDIEPDVKQQIQRILGKKAHFPGTTASLRRTGYLAACAWQRLLDGQHDNPATLEPMYLADPVRAKVTSQTS